MSNEHYTDGLRHCTVKGKVVYRRPKKMWGPGDLFRIWRAMWAVWEWGDFTESQKAEMVAIVNEVIQPALDDGFSFSGGEFGGGGATRLIPSI